MKLILLTITLFVLNSCTTADYWYNHIFVVPENPFEQESNWISHDVVRGEAPKTRNKVKVKFRDGRESESYPIHLFWGIIPLTPENEIIGYRL